MNRASLSLALFSLSLSSFSACTSATSHSGDGGSTGTQPGSGGAATGVGGAATGTGGAAVGTGGAATGTGGAAAGTGGAGAGTGGATGTGGAQSAIFKCPMPPASYTPLANTTSLPAPQPLTGVPPADNYSQGFSIIEGPAWLGNALYVSQIMGGNPPPPSRILKVVPGSPSTVFATNDGTNGLAILPDGDLVGAIHIDGSICRVPLASPNNLIPIAYQYMSARFNSPNDLAVRSDGNIYFSDPDNNQAPHPAPQGAGHTRVYRISPLPTAAVSVVDESLSQPNGVTLSLDENTLYVSGPGLYKYAVNADGSTGPRQDGVPNPQMYSGSDGMVFDCAGDLYVANNANVSVINPSGTKVGDITITASGVQSVSNVAFGGADRKTLFITTLGSTPGVFTIAMPLPGMPY
jgi:gluconolactonase